MNSNPQTPSTRPSLILRLRNASDLQAWEEFVEVYQPIIFSLAKHRGLQEADADDVTQEVLSRVANRIGGWDPDPDKGSFRGWLATITRNLSIQYFRESSRRPMNGVESRILKLPDPSTNGNVHGHEDAFDLERDRQLFLWAVRKVQRHFEPKTWQAFWLTAVDLQDVADVAAQLETTKSQIYVARSRVMNRLKRAVEQTEFDTHQDRGS